jgi:glycosyltransferase involved in cell wall biosynthesis
MRVLSYNQGAAGAGMMGAVGLDESLLIGLGSRPGIELELLGAPPSTLRQKLAARPWPPLSRLDADFHTARWHRVESRKARRTIDRAVAGGRLPDALLVNSQAVSFDLAPLMRRVPTLLHVDTLALPWAEMEIWRKLRRHSALTLAPSIRAEARAMRDAGAVLAWSGWAERQVLGAQPAARVFQWHPGLDVSRYRPATRRRLDRPRVLFIGGRFEQKGGHDLIDAVCPMLGHEVELHLVTPADVPEGSGIVVHRLDRSSPILLDLIQQSTMLCLPTHGDASPWVVLEAMACGTPVIASSVGGIPEMLDSGASGIVVPPGDITALRAAVRRLLEDGSLASELAARGMEIIHRRFDARRQGERLAEILEAVVGTSNNRGRADA